MRTFKDYFETPIPSGELYRAAKKSDKVLASKLQRRITGKEPEKADKQKFDLIKKEYIGAIQDLKEDLQKSISKLDPKKVKVTLEGESAFINISQILPKRYRDIDKLLFTDFDFENSKTTVENMTGLKLDNVLNSNRDEDEMFLNELIDETQKILNIDISLDFDKVLQFDIDYDAGNRTHFPGGIPGILKRMGLGKKLYLAVAYKLKMISSISDASPEAKTVWASLLTTAEDFYAFYNSRSTKRFIMLKTLPDTKKKSLITSVFEDIGNHYELTSVVNKTLLDAANEMFLPGKKVNRLDQLFSEIEKATTSKEEYKAKKTKINKFLEKGKKELSDAQSLDIFGNKTNPAFKSLRKSVIKMILKDSITDKELKTFIESNFL
jgi:hypothetical protein